MKNINTAIVICLLPFVFISIASCTYNHLPESNHQILLIRHRGPDLQTKDEFKTGMVWLLSYLGAKLPKESFDMGVKFLENNKLELNIDHLEFSGPAVNSLSQLIQQIKNSEEYKITGGIDAGRFFALCFNSTYHYYQITGAPQTYSAFSNKYASFAHKTFVCDTSSISNYSRILKYSISDLNINNNFFTAEEGSGVYSSGNFVKNGFIEAFDYMSNGQPRFVIYDAQGNLYVPSDRTIHPAGKPSKCMWCHESGMQPLFNNTPNISGFIDKQEFLGDQQIFTTRLNEFHSKSNSMLDFNDRKAHNQAEFIYLSFYEPNAERLAEEWNFSIDEVKKVLSGIATHDNQEFSFLKKVYYREQIKKFAPFKSLEVSDQMREATSFEPNYID